MQNQEQEKYLSEKALAKRWGVAPRTLQKWRWRGIGPPYIKIGIAVRYTPENIKKFEEENMHSTTSKNRSSCNELTLTTTK
jgi:hypothetical protein